MRLGWWRVVVLALACGLPGCGPDFSGPESGLFGHLTGSGSLTDCATAPYEGWEIYIADTPPPIEVGSSREVTIISPAPYWNCESSVRWWATVEGIVSFEPGPSADKAILTGEAPGRTHILAEVSLEDGTLRRARTPGNEPVTVVAASTGG